MIADLPFEEAEKEAEKLLHLLVVVVVVVGSCSMKLAILGSWSFSLV